MGRITWQGRDGEARLYDNGGNYVKIRFSQMDFDGPIARGRPVEKITPTVGGFALGPADPSSDEELYSPLPISFSFAIDDQDAWKIRAALGHPDPGPWVVGSTAWTTTKGKGSIPLFDSSYVRTGDFADLEKRAVDLEIRWTNPQSGSIYGLRYEELYTPPQQVTINESADQVTMRVQGLVYGTIRAISFFTVGTES